MQGWGWDSFSDPGIEVVHVQAVEVFSWNDEGDIAVKRFPLVLQFELAPARLGCHGCRNDSARGALPCVPLKRLLAEMGVYRKRPSFQLVVDYRRMGDWLG